MLQSAPSNLMSILEQAQPASQQVCESHSMIQVSPEQIVVTVSHFTASDVFQIKSYQR
jgi:hypothetical protein